MFAKLGDKKEKSFFPKPRRKLISFKAKQRRWKETFALKYVLCAIIYRYVKALGKRIIMTELQV